MPIGDGHPTHPFSTLGIAVFAPARSGVYVICNQQGQCVYVGQSNDIQRRLSEHLNDTTHTMHAHGGVSFAYDLVDGDLARTLRERTLILTLNPPCNEA